MIENNTNSILSLPLSIIRYDVNNSIIYFYFINKNK